MRMMGIDASIKGRLALLCLIMSLHAADGKHSIHRVAENVFRDLLNVIYRQADFVNANLSLPNAPGFDLVSHKNRILVQVTTENTKDKIISTVEQCDVNTYKGYRLIILIIVEKKVSIRKFSRKNAFVEFNLKEDVWDMRAFARRTGDLSIDDMEKVKRILDKCIGFSAPMDENESALEQIIQIFAREDADSDENDCVVDTFEIDCKININNLNMRYSLILDRCGSSSVVSRVYDRYEQEGVNKRKSVISTIRREYLMLADSLSGADLYDKLLDNLVNRISYATSLMGIKKEDALRYCELLMVDAFVKCKIFKKP